MRNNDEAGTNGAMIDEPADAPANGLQLLQVL
jgi:hypothetical protein